MRALLAIAAVAGLYGQAAPEAPAAPPAPAALVNEGKPMAVASICTEDDMQTLGLACTPERPCPVYLELTSLDVVADRMLVAGNLHTDSATLSSILLASDDAGKSWTEAHPRLKNTTLGQTQFFDLQAGWISGQTVAALPRDPFFLLTTDGGKTWTQRPVLSEPGPGSVEQFYFDSRTSGSVILDRSAGAEGGRYALYETQTGGESWSVRSTARTRTELKTRSPLNPAWRLQAHAPSKSYRLERLDASRRWSPVASFLVAAGECKPGEMELQEPPPAADPAKPPSDAVEVFQVGGPPKTKPAKPAPKKKP